MSNSRRFSEFMFWAFCLVVLSKVVWYDIRVYWPPSERREIMTACYAGWIAAQGLVYVPIAFQLLRQFRPAVFVFVAAIAPYLLLGVIDGRINTFLIGDFARYGASVGFLLFSLWAVKNVSPKTMVRALITVLAFYFVIRLAIHLSLAEKNMRFGRDWEVMLTCLLVALSAYMHGYRYFVVLAAVAVVVMITSLGLTRALMAGLALGAIGVVILSLIDGRFSVGRGARTFGAAALVVFLVAAPMLANVPFLSRLSISKVVTEADEADPYVENGSQEAPSTTLSGTSKNAVETDDQRELEMALLQWEEAIGRGDHSMGSRNAESAYFLTAMRQDAWSMFVGPGGGDFVSVTTPRAERLVRGAHNTYVTLLYRHGIVAGSVLIYFLVFFGLPTNFMQLRTATDPHWRMLLTGLIAYRGAAVAQAYLHQGLLDDPLVFLSIAIALAGPKAPAITSLWTARTISSLEFRKPAET